MSNLVLSLFPGIGLLDRAFEAEGFCIVRGPDPLWGGDIHDFHPPSGVFDGVIGGPPCQSFSRMAYIVRAKGYEPKPNLIPEFERVVGEAQPTWFVMENVEGAPEPVINGYAVSSVLVNNRWIGVDVGNEQNRDRRFCFGVQGGVTPRPLDVSADLALFQNPKWERAVMASSANDGALFKSQEELKSAVTRRIKGASLLRGARRPVERCAELQGLPTDFLKDAPFTVKGKYTVIGNGVPIPLGRAIARAVKRALEFAS